MEGEEMKYYGKVGFAYTDNKTDPAIWEEKISERVYYGDIIRNNRRRETTDQLNDNITVNNTISIIADPYAYDHFFAIRYVSWMGSLWNVTNVEVQRPRLILTIGGVYNGANETESGDDTGNDSEQS